MGMGRARRYIPRYSVRVLAAPHIDDRDWPDLANPLAADARRNVTVCVNI